MHIGAHSHQLCAPSAVRCWGRIKLDAKYVEPPWGQPACILRAFTVLPLLSELQVNCKDICGACVTHSSRGKTRFKWMKTKHHLHQTYCSCLHDFGKCPACLPRVAVAVNVSSQKTEVSERPAKNQKTHLWLHFKHFKRNLHSGIEKETPICQSAWKSEHSSHLHVSHRVQNRGLLSMAKMS